MRIQGGKHSAGLFKSMALHEGSIMKNILLALAIAYATGPAFATEVMVASKAGAAVYTYSTPTDATEVAATIRKVVKEDVNNKKVRQIYVISGTHGAADGSIGCKDFTFKKEDKALADVTRTNVNVRDYNAMSGASWKELSDRSGSAVIVLAWCYSNQWLSNTSADGNTAVAGQIGYGGNKTKIAMK
jgi:hypothetical protein